MSAGPPRENTPRKCKLCKLSRARLRSARPPLTNRRMSRPPAWRTQSARYPHAQEVPTRFQDLDPLGHVNNVAMAAIFESGRVAFNRRFNWPRGQGARVLIARVDLSYLAEAHFPAAVMVANGVGRVGRTSWTIFAAAFQEGACVALCDATLVVTGPEGARPLSDGFRWQLGEAMVGEA